MPTTAISIVWEDVEGKKKSEVLFFDAGDVATVADAQTQLTAYETLLQNVSGCVISHASVSFPLTVETVEQPDAGYDVRAGAYLGFRDSFGEPQGIYVPGILGGKIANDVVVDPAADEQIEDLVNAILGSGANGEEPLSSRNTASQWQSYRGGKGTSRKV